MSAPLNHLQENMCTGLTKIEWRLTSQKGMQQNSVELKMNCFTESTHKTNKHVTTMFVT